MFRSYTLSRDRARASEPARRGGVGVSLNLVQHVSQHRLHRVQQVFISWELELFSSYRRMGYA